MLLIGIDMPLIYHERGHNKAGDQAGSSVELFLNEGIKSKTLLRKEGKLPPEESPYERAGTRRQKWIEERKTALASNPTFLNSVLASSKESDFIDGNAIFYKPGHPGHREDNVFFGYHAHPSADRDWVAIEVPDSADLHDASCRDEQDPQRWINSSVPINEFIKMQKQNLLPQRWNGRYNEHLIYGKVEPDKIVAYAKVEKELPIESGVKFSQNQLDQVKKFVNYNLNFATQFDSSEDNILLNLDKDKYQIRVSFNKTKVTGNEKKVKEFFEKFNSMNQLVEEASKFSTTEAVKKLKSSKVLSSKDDITVGMLPRRGRDSYNVTKSGAREI
jgi:hypothetical protein